MSIDAMLLEPYRDPREIWIALRTDGAIGSGTLSDPYDGGKRSGVVLPASVSLVKTDAVVTTFSDNNLVYLPASSVVIFGVTGSGADIFNQSFALNRLSARALKVTLSQAPTAGPSDGDIVYCGGLDTAIFNVTGLATSPTLSEFMEVEVTVSGTLTYVDKDRVRIAGVTEGMNLSPRFNGVFSIYGVAAPNKFKYRVTRPGIPSALGGTAITSTKVLNILEVRLSWPVAKVITASNHDYLAEEIVTIAGVPSSPASDFNGEFLIDGPKDATTFYYKLPSIPAADVTYNTPGSTAARVVHRFDEVMRVAPARAAVHLGPGIFETRGHNAYRPYYNPQAGTRTINWLIKTGQTIRGAGLGATTVRLMYATAVPSTTEAFANQPGLANPDPDSRFCDGFCLSDLTVDCNQRQQIRERVAKVAAGVMGRHIRLRRVRAIDFGTHFELVECFVLGVAKAAPQLSEAVDCRIERSVVEQPSLNGFYTNTGLILFAGENDTGEMGWHRAGAIRHNYFNHEYVDRPIRVASIIYADLGMLATVTTVSPHGRANNEWVVLNGALVNGLLANPFNGSHQITWVSNTVFQVTLKAAPAGPPNGEIWIDRIPWERISVQKVQKDPADTDGWTSILTSHTPHNRKVGQWVNVWQVGSFPPPAGTEPYWGRFPVTAVDSPTVLRYRMNAVPKEAGVADSVISDFVLDSIFIGANGQGWATDGGSEAIAEGNWAFSAYVGGSYTDFYGTKDQTDRNNYHSGVVAGPFRNMGGTSALKLIADKSVPNNIATITTSLPHGMVAGQAVRIASSLGLDAVNRYYRVLSVTSHSLIFDTEGVPLPSGPAPDFVSYFAAVWQSRQIFQENNFIELVDVSHIGGSFGQSVGIAVGSSASYPIGKKVFQSVLARGNLVTAERRQPPSFALPGAVGMGTVERAIVEDNAVGVPNSSPIFINDSGPLYFSNNYSTASTSWIEPTLGTTDSPFPSLASRIEELTLFSI